MSKLDETEIIKKFQAMFGNKRFVSEDVESFKLGNTTTIVKVDTLVESTDIPPKMTLKQAARKSVIACVSDFASKGVKPKFGIISVNFPAKVTRLQLSQITSGFREAAKEFGIKFLGGDTNQGKEFVFNVCLFGKTEKIVKRQGAKSGDLIFVTGPFGLTGAGFHILLKKIKSQNPYAKKAINSVLRPKPRFEFGLKSKKFLSSSMDSSDGLSTTLNEMVKQSNCKFVLHTLPTDNNTIQFAKKRKQNLNSLVFHTGEEYEFAFTIPKKYKSHIVKIASMTKTPIIEIGEVYSGKGVFLNNDKLYDMGYHHF